MSTEEIMGTAAAPQDSDFPPMSRRASWLAFFLMIALYLALLLPTIRRPGIQWDEQVDLDITRSYLADGGDWLRGSSFDGSQTRLPMYSVALLFRLLGGGGLIQARCASALMGALTMLSVHLYCLRFLDGRRGRLACLLLATSPFYLSFARIALTESDIFVTCALSWFLLCASCLARERSAGWGLATGLSLGLAISSKFTAIAMIPVGILAPALGPPLRRGREGAATGRGGALPLVGVALLLGGLIQAWWAIWRMGSGISESTLLRLWLGGIVLWAVIAAWQFRRRTQPMGAAEGGLFVAGFAAATFLLLPPVHTTNPAILLELARRAFLSIPLNLRFLGEAVIFYAGCLLFKSSPLVGAGMAAGTASAILQWRSRPEIRVGVACFIAYLALLLKMTLAQTFYLMPLLPVTAVFAADQLQRLRRRRPRAAGALLAASLLLLGLDLARCYPDYNLNGYQYLGARRLAGRSTVGYRGIVQLTTDGVQQALEWACLHIPPGRTVATYITAPHIVRAFCPDPPFRMVDGLTGPPLNLGEADYVIIGINAEIADDWGPPPREGEVYRSPCDPKALRENFIQVFSVRRAFHFVVASVWERKGQKATSTLPLESNVRSADPPL
jgi:4-amino-4-deoxy-L-arabinose transferase-like glycosyltransferase